MHTKKELDEKLIQAGISPLKNLGQNFLVNPHICERILEAVKKTNPKTIVEIGPGLGALTDDLLKFKSKTVLIELDRGLVKYWEEKRGTLREDMQIIHGDALQISWDNLDLQGPVTLVSNLPYSIAASVVMDMCLKSKLNIEDMVLMFQKEVAQRLQAHENEEDYGMLSVVAQSFWKIEKVLDAGPQDFYPVPNVGSRVLHFSKLKEVHLGSDFINFVKLAFSQRRKKIVSNLSSNFDKGHIEKTLQNLGLSKDTRAQELNPELFQKLFDDLSKTRI